MKISTELLTVHLYNIKWIASLKWSFQCYQVGANRHTATGSDAKQTSVEQTILFFKSDLERKQLVVSSAAQWMSNFSLYMTNPLYGRANTRTTTTEGRMTRCGMTSPWQRWRREWWTWEPTRRQARNSSQKNVAFGRKKRLNCWARGHNQHPSKTANTCEDNHF